jgi:hypothetical protein
MHRVEFESEICLGLRVAPTALGSMQRLARRGEIVASWGAALRTGTAGSQDESRCSAIHKQRPYGPGNWRRRGYKSGP